MVGGEKGEESRGSAPVIFRILLGNRNMFVVCQAGSHSLSRIILAIFLSILEKVPF